MNTVDRQKIIETARGTRPADLVLKNARFFNPFTNSFERGDIAITSGVIAGVGEYGGCEEIDLSGLLVTAGLIDSHIHIESSMLTPNRFAEAVVPHGTTTVVTDPHEIANVMGAKGIEYMLAAAKGLPFDIKIMLPSCVPATPIEESGAVLHSDSLEPFYGREGIAGLAEVMNYPGVIGCDPVVLDKIAAAEKRGLPVDGHAPSLSGKRLDAYISAGIGSDHECSDCLEALEKLSKGQYIMIREGTAAQNLEALMPLLNERFGDRCLLATDDKHPSDLINKGHIDYILRKAVALGAEPSVAIKAATFNPSVYFEFKTKGAIAPHYSADITVFDNERDFNVLKVFKDGQCVYGGSPLEFPSPQIDGALAALAADTFIIPKVVPKALELATAPLIGLVPHEIITRNLGTADKVSPESDILKIAVAERHKGTGHIGLAYLQGYGLKRGAVATSVAHDSHNIIAAGVKDSDIAAAINAVADMKGGIAVVDKGKVIASLRLEIAGLMTELSAREADGALEAAMSAAYALGASRDIDPLMTLSFAALPVIPAVRVTSTGVYDVIKQQFIS